MTRELLPIAGPGLTARYSVRLLARHPWYLAATVLAFVAANVCALVAPWALGGLVDDITSGASSGAVTTVFWLIAGAAVAGGALSVVASYALARTAEPALARLRARVLDRALALDSERLEHAGAGDLLSRVGDDARLVANAISEIIPLLLGSAFTIVLTGAGLFALDWRLGLAGLAVVPMYVLSLRWYLPRSGPYYARERVAQGERAEALLGGIRGAPTVRALSLERGQLDRIDRYSADAAQISIDVFKLLTRLAGRNNRAELVGLLLILGTGFALVSNDAVTVGAVTAAALYFHRLFNPIGAVVGLFDDIQSVGASLTRMVGVAQLAEKNGDTDAQPRAGGLVLDQITHHYDGVAALEEVSVTIHPGERVAVVGASGAGKSTLAAIAAGLLVPTQGATTLGNVALAELDSATLRKQICLISQEIHVFAQTLRQNVTLGRPHATDDEVRRSLAAANASRWSDALPDGLDTMLGPNAHRLTPAQAQQVALARVMLADPAIVVLDEATAEAGSAGAHELDEAAAAVLTGRAALIVAHRLSQTRSANRILVMDQGRIIEEGTHEHLLAIDGHYAELWHAWMST